MLSLALSVVTALLVVCLTLVWLLYTQKTKFRARQSVPSKQSELRSKPTVATASRLVRSHDANAAQEQSLFCSMLPTDVKRLVFAHLGPKDLVRCSQVCIEWYHLCRDDLFWRALYQRYMNDWAGMEGGGLSPSSTSYESGSSSGNSSSETGDSDWVARFAQQITANAQKVAQKHPSGTAFPGDHLAPHSQAHIPENAAVIPLLGSIRELFYGLVNAPADKTPVRRAGMFPGSRDVGSSLGIEVDGRMLLLCAINHTKQFTLEMVLASQSLKKNLLDRSSGIVFVTKAEADEKSMAEQRRILHYLCSEASSTNVDAAVLVFVPIRAGLRPADIVQQLGLDPTFSESGFVASTSSTVRRWRVQALEVDTLVGVAEGFSWLVSTFQQIFGLTSALL